MKKLPIFPIAASLAMSVATFANAQHYTQVNLVSNRVGKAPVTDKFLVNPCNLSRAAGSPWWAADNGSGFSTLYAGAGTKIPLNVSIPRSNPTLDRTVQGRNPDRYHFQPRSRTFCWRRGSPRLFCLRRLTARSQDGTNGRRSYRRQPACSAFCDHGEDHGWLGFYRTHERHNQWEALPLRGQLFKREVDVWDNAFHKVTLPAIQESNGNGDGDNDLDAPFTDARLPANDVPFNVQAIGNDIVVTYALHEDGNPIETDGPGLGRVDIYSSSGLLLRSLESGPWLNAPWGVALAPLDFGVFSHSLLIGQFAGGGFSQNSGTIAAYDLATGKFLGQMKNAAGATLAVNGLWAIAPGNGASPNNYDAKGAPASELYFTAGPNHGADGLFGYLLSVATELNGGNDQ